MKNILLFIIEYNGCRIYDSYFFRSFSKKNLSKKIFFKKFSKKLVKNEKHFSINVIYNTFKIPRINNTKTKRQEKELSTNLTLFHEFSSVWKYQKITINYTKFLGLLGIKTTQFSSSKCF